MTLHRIGGTGEQLPYEHKARRKLNMEAIDTVMKEEALLRLHPFLRETDTECLGCLELTCKTQAEISFDKGRKEVVEWADGLCDHLKGYSGIQHMPRRYCEDCWQAFKKKLGL